jgi:hypothetical protein
VNKQNTCETDPISLYFDKMRKKILSKTGAPYFQASGKIFQVAGVELSDPFFKAHGGHLQYVANKKDRGFYIGLHLYSVFGFYFQYVANKKDRCFMAVTFVAPLPPASCLMFG